MPTKNPGSVLIMTLCFRSDKIFSDALAGAQKLVHHCALILEHIWCVLQTKAIDWLWKKRQRNTSSNRKMNRNVACIQDSGWKDIRFLNFLNLKNPIWLPCWYAAVKVDLFALPPSGLQACFQQMILQFTLLLILLRIWSLFQQWLLMRGTN